MIGYVYLTTNLINNKKYIGSHHAEKLDESYLGSGILIQKAIQKYGKNNFSCQILKECDTEEDLVYFEEYYIKEFNAVEDDTFYNLSGSGYNRGITGYKHTEETKAKIGQFFKQKWDDPTYAEKFTHSGADNGFYGKNHSEETKQHLSEVWDYSKHITPEFKLKVSKAMKGKHHNNQTKEKIGQNSAGRIWVYLPDTNQRCRIWPSELQQYLELGYIIGFIKINKNKK